MTDVPEYPVADRPAAGTSRPSMTGSSAQMRQTATAEFRPNGGRTARFSVSAQPTGWFGDLLSARYRAGNAPRGDPGLATTRNRENVGLRTFSLSTLRLLAALAVLSSAAAHAEYRAYPCAALFDHPVAVQRVPSGGSADPIGEITCTYYADFMVRETGTDSPSPGAATIVPVPDASRRPLCNAAHAAREVSLKTKNYGLSAGKGHFYSLQKRIPTVRWDS